MLGPRNPEEVEVYAIEELLADTQYCIQSVMGRKKVSRSELAKRLGCTPANVTQMLSEDSNLTLESIARIFHALEDKVIVKSEYLESRQAWAEADTIPANRVLTAKHVSSAFPELQKKSLRAASAQSSFGQWQGWLFHADEAGYVNREANNLHDVARAA